MRSSGIGRAISGQPSHDRLLVALLQGQRRGTGPRLLFSICPVCWRRGPRCCGCSPDAGRPCPRPVRRRAESIDLLAAMPERSCCATGLRPISRPARLPHGQKGKIPSSINGVEPRRERKTADCSPASLSDWPRAASSPKKGFAAADRSGGCSPRTRQVVRCVVAGDGPERSVSSRSGPAVYAWMIAILWPCWLDTPAALQELLSRAFGAGGAFGGRLRRAIATASQRRAKPGPSAPPGHQHRAGRRQYRGPTKIRPDCSWCRPNRPESPMRSDGL